MGTMITRKEFLRTIGLGATSLFWATMALGAPRSDNERTRDIRGKIFEGDAPDKPWKWSKEAFFYEKLGETVHCLTCPNGCVLEPGDRSICRSKVNIDGKLYSLTYGNPCSANVDPIEKKPLKHFYSGSSIFSIAATGCNFRCLNCQNWEISQKKPEDVRFFELFLEEGVKELNKRSLHAIA